MTEVWIGMRLDDGRKVKQSTILLARLVSTIPPRAVLAYLDKRLRTVDEVLSE